ncbi:hypothetical protein BDN72DRAFT_67813 [Pluteus cervinus]|uniref:Uncharacterized protein n=1 Tax=Pluteus cervinus TaxID=181527 RepID=A0ACD2ZYU0_9AGAR|nr:hypothetical protein BDN72DRAFT_67813 [Pluteus cervinus]
MSSASMPDLPAEIWITILRAATLVPRFLGLHLLEAEFTRHPPLYTAIKDLPEHIKTRATIVLVCKQWRIWATPFLYEYVVIRSGGGLRPLLGALQSPPVASDLASSSGQQGADPEVIDVASFRRPFGNLVKRLDFALYEYSDDEPQATGQSHKDWEVITQIAECLPNLRSLNFYSYLQNDHHVVMPSSFAQALARTCGKSLRVLNTYHDRYRFPLPDLYGLLLHTPCLRVLRCKADSFSHYWGPRGRPISPTWPTVRVPEPFTKITLPRLSSVYLRLEFTGSFPGLLLPVLSTPHLRHAILHSPAHRELEAIPRSLLTGFSSVVSLQFYQDRSPFNYQALMHQLQEYCPELLRLDLYLQSWEDLTVGLELPPSLKCLCLATQPKHAGTTSSLTTLPSTFEAIRFNNVKSVTLIRIADKKNLQESPSQVYDSILKHLEGRGIRFA